MAVHFEKGPLMSEHLSHHHRTTLEHLFDHQRSNIHWREVRHLLEAVGTVEDEHNGKVKVTVGDDTIVIRDPGHHEIDKQLIVDLRKMLTAAGFGPDAA